MGDYMVLDAVTNTPIDFYEKVLMISGKNIVAEGDNFCLAVKNPDLFDFDYPDHHDMYYKKVRFDIGEYSGYRSVENVDQYSLFEQTDFDRYMLKTSKREPRIYIVFIAFDVWEMIAKEYDVDANIATKQEMINVVFEFFNYSGTPLFDKPRCRQYLYDYQDKKECTIKAMNLKKKIFEYRTNRFIEQLERE